MLPVLALVKNFPFALRGFHSESGSGYVNDDIGRSPEKPLAKLS